MLLAIAFLLAVIYLATSFAHFSSDKILVVLQTSGDPGCQIILQVVILVFMPWFGSDVMPFMNSILLNCGNPRYAN